jgi:hypothetical protein
VKPVPVIVAAVIVALAILGGALLIRTAPSTEAVPRCDVLYPDIEDLGDIYTQAEAAREGDCRW